MHNLRSLRLNSWYDNKKAIRRGKQKLPRTTPGDTPNIGSNAPGKHHEAIAIFRAMSTVTDPKSIQTET